MPAFVFAVALIPLVYGFERLLLSMGKNRTVLSDGSAEPFLQVEAPGLVCPPTSGVEGSGMRDDDEVIGVEIGGRARAYRLAALDSRTTHVVNDLLGGVPVTVTYCDLSNCVRGFTDPRGTTPLGFSVGGLYTENSAEMVVKLDGVFYLQKSGKSIRPGSGRAAIPYDSIEPTRTTWKEWVRLHPDTDVYIGERPTDPE
jgi:Protein of unknown function (DUF3179)